MSIDTNSISPGHSHNIGITNKHKDAPAKETQNSEHKPSSADTVTLTGDAAHLRQLDEAVSQSSGVDLDRVEAIKTAIAEGKFEMDSEKIASKLLELEQQLNR